MSSDTPKCTTEELINGMKHTADDHTCCRGTIDMAIEKIQRLERELREAKHTIARFCMLVDKVPDNPVCSMGCQCFDVCYPDSASKTKEHPDA